MPPSVEGALNAPSQAAHMLACEAQSWVRRGVIPGSAKWRPTMLLIREKRGAESAAQLEAAIEAWNATKDAWLPDAEQRVRPYAAQVTPTPQSSAGRRPSHPSRGFLARLRHGPD